MWNLNFVGFFDIWHYNVQQNNFITKCDRLLLQSASGITKCDRLYYKVRQALRNVRVITKWDVITAIVTKKVTKFAYSSALDLPPLLTLNTSFLLSASLTLAKICLHPSSFTSSEILPSMTNVDESVLCKPLSKEKWKRARDLNDSIDFKC